MINLCENIKEILWCNKNYKLYILLEFYVYTVYNTNEVLSIYESNKNSIFELEEHSYEEIFLYI